MGMSNNISNGLNELVKRSRKELIKMQDNDALKYEKTQNADMVSMR